VSHVERPPPLDAVLAVDPAVLSGKLLTIPDEENALLRLADGRRTVKELLAKAGLDERLALASLERLLDAGILRVLSRGPDGADWFAHPGTVAAEEPEPEPLGEVPDGPAPAPSPRSGAQPVHAIRAVGAGESAASPGRARAWVMGAAVALGALILAGAVWAGRQRGLPPVPQASSSPATSRPGGDGPPPALLVTEPGSSAAYREAMAEVETRYQSGDLAAAAAACRRATEVDPSIGAGWMALGEVQLAAGDRLGARAAFERYLAVEPEGRHAARVRALLERLRP
jgi:hypothetical protein